MFPIDTCYTVWKLPTIPELLGILIPVDLRCWRKEGTAAASDRGTSRSASKPQRTYYASHTEKVTGNHSLSEAVERWQEAVERWQ
ncbi:hypothetical protein J6590_005300 [Homalodisca vitripennis]|nr:hypothetical protein J6590_005300 [Homalodisca vitripennis]